MIVGQRFVQHYEAIASLLPDAIVIDINLDISKNAKEPGKNLIDGFKNITTMMGQIFETEA